MGYILSLLTKLDAAVQKRFDSICFFLMRRFGVRKSMIRYAIAALAATALASAFLQLGIWYSHPLLFSVIAALCALTIMIEQAGDLEKDRQAESSIRTGSEADIGAYDSAKVAWLISGIVTTAAFIDKPASIAVCFGHFFVCALAHEYLKKTPMNPPAEKAREHVGMPQPTPAKS
ncbi:MAG: hypothetical protein QY323_05805 [Patescibacteria group bacterium]|nr:MAG: hypothetical protein QY323_05805 [Patescibacteria group bacterium]